MYVNGDNVAYFDSFTIEYTPKETKKFIENKNIETNIYRIKASDSIMCGYICIEFNCFMYKSKSLLDYTNLFSPNEYEKNNKIIVKYFQ